MGTPIRKASFSSEKVRVAGLYAPAQTKIAASPTVFVSTASDEERGVSCAVFVNQYGQKKNYKPDRRGGCIAYPTQNASNEDYFESKQVRYPGEHFKTPGLHNGFPFPLDKNNPYLECYRGYNSSIASEHWNYVSQYKDGQLNQKVYTNLGPSIGEGHVSGIYVDSSSYSVSVLNGGYNLSANKGYYRRGNMAKKTVANNFWNLAAIEVDFLIKTMSAPSEYETGYCYDPESSSSEGVQRVSMDYEIVNTYDEEAYLPSLRQYIEKTGQNISQESYDEFNVINTSGSGYSSAFIHGDPVDPHDCGMFLPLTIQPENTGAFVISFDSGVANWFSSLPQYGQVETFNCNMMFDYGTTVRDHEGFTRNGIEYNSFVNKCYLVPADGWKFKVVGSKVKGIYYQYPFNPKEREIGGSDSNIDATTTLTDDPVYFMHSIQTPSEFGAHDLRYNDLPLNYCIFEPNLGNSSRSGGDIYETIGKGKNYIRPKNQALSYQTFSDLTSIYTIPSNFNLYGEGDSFFAGIRTEINMSQYAASTYLEDTKISSPTPKKHIQRTHREQGRFSALAKNFKTPYSTRLGGKVSRYLRIDNPLAVDWQGERLIENDEQEYIKTDRYIIQKTNNVMPDSILYRGGNKLLASNDLFPEVTYRNIVLPASTLEAGRTAVQVD